MLFFKIRVTSRVEKNQKFRKAIVFLTSWAAGMEKFNYFPDIFLRVSNQIVKFIEKLLIQFSIIGSLLLNK